MTKIYKICLDADCQYVSAVSEAVILNYFDNLAWI
jgi:hypothetical protein